MATISAASDIVTDKGFTVAHKGERGKAVKGVKPQDPANWGKVLCYFSGRSHGYWCEPAKLAFDNSNVKSRYVAEQAVYDPYANTPKLPAAAGFYEFDFGRNLKLCRKSRRLSQGDLGRLMGTFGLKLAQSTICYRESTKECPGGKFVMAASKALKVPPFALFVPLHDCRTFDKAKRYLNSVSSSVCAEEKHVTLERLDRPNHESS